MLNNETARQMAENVARIRERMAEAARAAGRDPGEILLCAACKTRTVEEVCASARLPIDLFGENHVQELVEKSEAGAYGGKPAHFIGHLQTNKIKKVLGRASLIQSVDSERLVLALEKEAAKLDLVQDILLEVNIGEEASKTGVPPEALWALLDTAAAYRNEQAVGAAVACSGIARSEVFVTTKLWVQDAGYDSTLRAFDASLMRLGLDYLDLYLIHQPFGDYYGAWRAMERLYREGAVRAIGVSNFSPERLVDLCMNHEIRPMVNQIEIHPFSSRTPPCGSWRTMGSCPRRGAPSPRRRKTFSTTRR